MTSGRWISPSSRLLPGKRVRASRKAAPMPRGRLQVTLQNATRRLRRMASSSRSVSGSTWTQDREPVFLEHGARLVSGQIAVEGLGGIVVVFGDNGDGIHDRRVAVFRKLAGDLHLVGHQRIGAIDHAGGGFATLHQREGGAYILGPRDLWLDGRPQAELLQRRLAIASGRYALRITHSQLAVADQTSKIHVAGLEVSREAAVLRRDQRQRVAQEV